MSSGEPEPPRNDRLMSLDALRGFDMFWIIGADDLVQGLDKASHSAIAAFARHQLSHKKWEGLVFYDCIFPLFVFLAGVSLVFSVGRVIAAEGKRGAYKRLFRRALLLMVLGALYYGGISKGWDQIRWVGVLQRIGLASLGAGLLLCHLKTRGLIAVTAGILIGYWALLSFVPVPDVGVVSVTMEHNWARWVDSQYLPGKRWDGEWDPEGLLSTLPAVATCLLGVLAGLLLKDRSVDDRKKVRTLLVAGAACVVIGYLWGLQFPIVKKIWTSTFVLVAGGYSLLLLGAFYWIIDVRRHRRHVGPLLWIGMNPLTVYLASNLVSPTKLAQRFVGGEIEAAFGAWGEVMVALVALALAMLFVRFLYQRKIFLRV